jgi:D-arginine dehydrogenase
MKSRRVTVVGGGVAGLAVAYHLGRAPAVSVLLVEQEAGLAFHSSGRNAAIFEPLDARAVVMALAERTRACLDDLLPAVTGGWLRPTGFVYVAPREALLAGEVALARQTGTPHEVLDARGLTTRLPALVGGESACGLWLPDAGVIDIHAVTGRLAAALRAAGVEIRLGCTVSRLRVRGGQVEGVELQDRVFLPSDVVVLAAGAWAGALGTSCGAPLPLGPLRRHLVQLDADEVPPADAPTVWALGDEVYFRPESAGVLASPCDEEPWPPEAPPSDPAALERLAARLAQVAPGLGGARVRRAWACLRTFTPDRGLVAGADPRIGGLFWLAGLGGSGMTRGLGAGEVVAAAVLEQDHPSASVLAPARVLEPARAQSPAGSPWPSPVKEAGG